MTFEWHDSYLTSDGGIINCGPLVWTIVNLDGSTIDQDLFKFDGASRTLTIESSNVAKAGDYGLRLTASYQNYPHVSQTVDLAISVQV